MVRRRHVHDITERNGWGEAAATAGQLRVILQGVRTATRCRTDPADCTRQRRGRPRHGFATAEEFLAAPVQAVLARYEMTDEHGLPLVWRGCRDGGRSWENGIPSSSSAFRILASGEERWSLVKARPVFDEHGDVVFAINIFTTYRAQARRGRDLCPARQQEIVAELGRRALHGTPLPELWIRRFAMAPARWASSSARCSSCSPTGDTCCCGPATAGPKDWWGAPRSTPADSQAGFTLRSSDPVIVLDLPSESGSPDRLCSVTTAGERDERGHRQPGGALGRDGGALEATPRLHP